jgi:hypothetical protein
MSEKNYYLDITNIKTLDDVKNILRGYGFVLPESSKQYELLKDYYTLPDRISDEEVEFWKGFIPTDNEQSTEESSEEEVKED